MQIPCKWDRFQTCCVSESFVSTFFSDSSRRIMWILAFFYGFLTTAQAISTSWSPSFPTPTASALHQGTVAIFENAHSLYDAASSSLLAHHEEDRCTLYKIAMKQQLYFEVRKIHYSSYETHTVRLVDRSVDAFNLILILIK